MDYEFKGVYYTNLARSTKRNFLQAYQFNTLGFRNVVRLEGMDGQHFADVEAVVDAAIGDLSHFAVYRKRPFPERSFRRATGSLCCHWSMHRMLRQLQLDLGENECAFYCHDDTHVRKRIEDFLKAIAQMPPFSIIQLFWWEMRDYQPLTDDQTLPKVADHFHPGINRCGDSALILTRDGAAQLQALSVKYPFEPMDMLVYWHHDELRDAYHVGNYWEWTGHSHFSSTFAQNSDRRLANRKNKQ